MKLLLALVLSLLLHGWLSQFTWQVPVSMAGSAGRPALAIRSMRIAPVASPASKQIEQPRVQETLSSQLVSKPKEAVKAETPVVEKPIAEPLQQEPPPAEVEKFDEPDDADEPEQVELTQHTPLADMKSEGKAKDQRVGVETIPTMQQPRYLNAPPPRYPRMARKRGYQGTVMIRALIDEKGRVKSAEVKSSSGYGVLDKCALKAVTKWRFDPNRVDGLARTSWVVVPVEFVLGS